ncbi:MAG: ABC transporter permease [Micrococcaceae bacterium]
MNRLRHATREDRLLLIGLPIFVALLLIGWGIWRSAASLDEIEARLLTWQNIGTLTWEHLLIVVVCAVLVVGTAVPVGILLTRPGTRGVIGPVLGVANAGQAAPVVGVIVLLALLLGFGFWVAVLALTLYAFLPVLANTITGLRGVEPSLIEAARGMGMSGTQVLLRVELPIAIPVIMTGVRTALVLLVGAGAFASFIDAGGLGLLIQTGILMFRFSILVSGALLVAALALAVEWVGRLLEVIVKPGGLA